MAPPIVPERIDCHLHAGLERRETFEEVFEYFARDGRKVVGLVDHAEVYLRRPPSWAAMSLAEARTPRVHHSQQADSCRHESCLRGAVMHLRRESEIPDPELKSQK